MLTLVEKIAFIILAVGSLYYGAAGFRAVYRAILRGKPDFRFDQPGKRIGRAVWTVLSQRSVFKNRPVVSAFHGMVFYGFVFYFLVNVVDLFEGFISFHPRGGVWSPFNLLADLMTTAVLVGMVGLLLRRFVGRPPALGFHDKVPLHEGVLAGIRRDSAIVGTFILFHVGSRLMSKVMQAAQTGKDPYQPVASTVASLFTEVDPGALVVSEHFFWWGALGSILLFLPYFPRSKHIHIFLAPVNLALNKAQPGTLDTMDFEQDESFGAAKLEELPWPRLLDAYSCIMCNRCQDVCPAYTTGKSLSPAAILINERYELNRILSGFSAGEESPRPLVEFAINDEATWACTTCNACVEACPVGNEQLLHIMDIRRERVLMEAAFPSELKNAYNGMETAGNPFALSHEQRMEWADKLPFKVPTVQEKPTPEVLYWVGCGVAFDPRAQKIAQSMAKLLEAAGLNWAVLGKQERCTGDPARRSGNEYLFVQLAEENNETLKKVPCKVIVTTCPHCFHTIKNEYPQIGGHYVVKHHTEFIEELLREGKLPSNGAGKESVTYHDPCYLGRHNGVFDEPRRILQKLDFELTETARKRENSFCCGAGGAQFWKNEEPGQERVSTHRYRELAGTGAKTLATGCPFCMKMLSDEAASKNDGMKVMDVAELVAERLP